LAKVTAQRQPAIISHGGLSRLQAVVLSLALKKAYNDNYNGNVAAEAFAAVGWVKLLRDPTLSRRALGRGGKGQLDLSYHAIKMPPTVILGLVPRTQRNRLES
jgi:hypothetical protein